MIVTKEEAINIFEKLPRKLKSYYHHPEYVVIDSFNKKNTKSLFYIITNNDEIFFHAFHNGKVKGTDLYDIQSPYGYGGPILSGSTEFLDYAINKYKKWCEENNILLEFVRFHPSSKNHLNYYGDVFENRQTVSINLTKEDLLMSFNSRMRTSVRKSIKREVNVIFSKDEKYISGFIGMYNELMKSKNAEQEYFFEEKYFRELLISEHVYLVNAINNKEELIGSSIFFLYGDKAEYHLSTSNSEGRELNVPSLLIYEFGKYAKENSAEKLNLGGGTDSSLDNSLLYFKQGFSKTLEPYYIGSSIYLEEKYNEMKRQYVDLGLTERINRIMFYR